MGRCIALIVLLAASSAANDAKRILYLTATAGFRHSSIQTSHQVLTDLAEQSGRFEVVITEDVSLINADYLRDFDAVFFFTSGELALSDQQKAALLDFVSSGKGFGGAHSATDTLYTWPAYGDLIGGYFDGHPWVQNAGVIIENHRSPIVAALGRRFEIVEEYYQFRDFSRGHIHVLAHLDTSTVDLNPPGVNRPDGDFALAWTRDYGAGRVFYTALGHFEETWLDPRFQSLLLRGLLWLVDPELRLQPAR